MTVEVAWGGQEITRRGGDSLCCQPEAEPGASPGSGGFSKPQSFLEYQFSPGVM